MRQMEAISKMEPMLPMDKELIPLLELAGDLRAKSAKMMPQIGSSARTSLSLILRGMNSYYSNKIEGQHTYPADLESAIKKVFSADAEVKRRQKLAVAHMEVERELEEKSKGMSWSENFQESWIKEIHKTLYEKLDGESRTILGCDGTVAGEMIPGELRTGMVKVGDHLAPEPQDLHILLNHFKERYGDQNSRESMKLVIAGASLHRLSWIHPFPDGNGRVSRLQNHLLLHHLGLTEGLWSPMRGLARRQGDYYGYLHQADLARRNDYDGRGSLSSDGLAKFIEFWLGICLDQVDFMTSLLSLESMQSRYVSLSLQVLHDYGSGSVLHHRSKLRPDLLGKALYRLFIEGKLDRGEFKAMLDTSDRTASRVLSNLLTQGLVVSDSRVGPIETNFPFFSLKFLFPGLWPEAEGIMAPPQTSSKT